MDALRWDYLDHMVYLKEIADKNIFVEKLKPSAGFCERVEVLTGVPNVQSGYFTAIDRLNPEWRPGKLASFWAIVEKASRKLEENLPYSKAVFKIRRKVTRSLKAFLVGKDNKLPIYDIPLEIYGQFGLTEDLNDQKQANAFSVSSLVDDLLSRNQTVDFSAFTALGEPDQFLTDDDRMEYICRNLKGSSDAATFLYLGELDAMGHYYGPDSLPFKTKLKHFDEKLKKFLAYISSIEDLDVILIGDHGMSTVRKTIKFKKEIEKAASVIGIPWSEITLFCDSTIGRIWLSDQKKLKDLQDYLIHNEFLRDHGDILTKELASKYEIPYDPSRHGQVLWYANNGVVLSPDFFHGNFAPKGMHGYLPGHSDTLGCAIIIKKGAAAKKLQERELWEINSIYENQV